MIVSMRPTFHAVALVSSIIVAYLWLKTPLLLPYSIQAVAASTLIYFILKRARFWQVLPDYASFGLVLVTFSLLLIIGKTGNLTSPLYPLTYIHLFFLVMSTYTPVAVVVMATACLFHLSLAPIIDLSVLVHVATLPIVMLFFLFAKQQHQDLVINNQKLEGESKTIDNQQHDLDALANQLDSLKTQHQINLHELAEMKNLISLCTKMLDSWQTQFFRCEPEIQKQIQNFIRLINLKTGNTKNENRQTKIS